MLCYFHYFAQNNNVIYKIFLFFICEFMVLISYYIIVHFTFLHFKIKTFRQIFYSIWKEFSTVKKCYGIISITSLKFIFYRIGYTHTIYKSAKLFRFLWSLYLNISITQKICQYKRAIKLQIVKIYSFISPFFYYFKKFAYTSAYFWVTCRAYFSKTKTPYPSFTIFY